MTKTGYEPLTSIDAITAGLASVGYISTREISTAIYLAHNLRKPILIEGPAGVGKTDLAASMARYLDVSLNRLQCYEGLDEGKALYEWKYGKQLLYTQLLKEKLGEVMDGAGTLNAAFDKLTSFEDLFYSETFLEPRPLLTAMKQDKGSVLLIDEIDKSDEEFEAYLLEILSDFQVTVPELGTISATSKPVVILTSNGTRDLSDALRRRCLYSYVAYPDRATELAILKSRCPEIEERLADQVIGFVQKLREEELEKTPGIAEMLDFAAALMGLGIADLTESPAALQATLTTLLKTQSDQAQITRDVAARIAGRAA